MRTFLVSLVLLALSLWAVRPAGRLDLTAPEDLSFLSGALGRGHISMTGDSAVTLSPGDASLLFKWAVRRLQLEGVEVTGADVELEEGTALLRANARLYGLPLGLAARVAVEVAEDGLKVLVQRVWAGRLPLPTALLLSHLRLPPQVTAMPEAGRLHVRLPPAPVQVQRLDIRPDGVRVEFRLIL